MEVKCLDEWKLTDEGYYENTVQTAGDGRIGARFTFRIDRDAYERIERGYENAYQFVAKPGVMRFLIENAQPAPAPHGIEISHNRITLTDDGLRFIEKWMSVSKDSSE